MGVYPECTIVNNTFSYRIQLDFFVTNRLFKVLSSNNF